MNIKYLQIDRRMSKGLLFTECHQYNIFIFFFLQEEARRMSSWFKADKYATILQITVTRSVSPP